MHVIFGSKNYDSNFALVYWITYKEVFHYCGEKQFRSNDDLIFWSLCSISYIISFSVLLYNRLTSYVDWQKQCSLYIYHDYGCLFYLMWSSHMVESALSHLLFHNLNLFFRLFRPMIVVWDIDVRIMWIILDSSRSRMNNIPWWVWAMCINSWIAMWIAIFQNPIFAFWWNHFIYVWSYHMKSNYSL